MKKIKKFMFWFLLTVAMLELLKLGAWLMNQRDDYQFYLGLFIVGGIFVSCTAILFNEFYKLIEKSDKNKNK